MKKLLPGALLLLAFLSHAAHVSGQNLTITSTSPLPPGDVSTPYSFQFGASGVNENSLVWSASSGIPPGLSLDQDTGVLSGTPSVVGNYSFVIGVAYTNGEQSTAAPFTLAIRNRSGGIGPTITSSATLSTAERNAPYSFTFTATGGDGQFVWSVVSGSLPSGLSLSPGGVLAGYPTVAPGRYFFGVQVLSNALTANQFVSLTVVSAVAVSSASPLPAADAGSPYSFSFQATGGQSPYGWAVASGAPPGLSINSGGILFGTPSSTGVFTFDVTVSDNLGGTNSKSFQITVNPAVAITSNSPLPAGETSAAYSFQFAGSGGSLPYTWSVAPETTIPAGLTLTSGGLLSGTPNSPQSALFGITLTDAAGGTATKIFQLQIGAGPIITSSSPLPAGTVNSPYSFTFLASGGTGSNTWSVVSGSLPAGLSLGASTGIQSGTPSAAGASSFAVSVHDSSGGTATGSFGITINPSLAVTSASPLPSGEVSRPYSFTFTGSGGSGSYTWSLPSGSSLPAGLTLSSGGTLSGTPTAPGTTSFSVQLADGIGNTAAKSFQLQIVAAPGITTTSPLPAGTVNSAYGPLTFTGSGGTTPFQWSSSQLTAGLSLSSGGVLSGTPTSAGSSSFSVVLTDAAGATASATFSLSVSSQLTITSTSPLPAGTVSTPYSFAFQASGGSGSYTWSVASGTVPSGLTLGVSTGVLSGTPASAGTANFVLAVHDGSGGTANGSFALTINSGLSISSASPLATGEVSRPYSFTFSGSGGSGSYTWSLPSGSSLPAGLTLSSGGSLGGTPTTAGTASFLIQIADGSGSTATKVFQLQILAAPSITTTSPLPAGTLNSAYGPLTLTESGGTAPFQWSSSPLPAGLSLSSGGVLSGTPSSTGTSSFSVTVTDAAGATASATFSLSVFSQLAIASSSPLPAGAANSPYSFTFQAAGGSGSYTWSLASGTLPNGLALNGSSGTLSGTPTATGTSGFVIQVADIQRGNTVSKTFSLTVNTSLSITSASPLSAGEVLRPYSFTFSGTGGAGSYTWSLPTGSSLPAGLTLSSGGSLGGTPTMAGTTSFLVQIADGSGSTASKTFQLQIVAAPSITTTSPLPTGTANSAYGPLTFAGSGGTAPYRWSSSALPAGLSLSSGGVLSGTPINAASSTFSVTLTDAAGATASATFSLSVFSRLTITSGSPLPAGAVNSPYNFTFQARGGTPSKTWSVLSGSLPNGLSLGTSTGLLSGIPSAAGASSFVVSVHDSAGGTANASFGLTINSSLTITSASPLAAGEVSRPYSFTFSGSGGSGSYTWSVVPGASLPAGLTLSTGGSLAGTPTAPGTASFSVRIADGSGNTATKVFQIRIAAVPRIITVSPLPPGTLNSAYGPLTFDQSGGTAPFGWSSSQLPAGLILSSAGVLSGTPNSTGTNSFSVTVTDAAGASASGLFSLSVFSQLTIGSDSPLPAGAVSSPYSFTFQAGGGSGSYTWSVASGALPNGLALNGSSGTLSGTPTATGTYGFVIQVADVQRESVASKTFSLTVNNGLSITSASPLRAGEVSRPYSFTFSGTGGSGSYTWSLPSGSSLPGGLTLSEGGSLSGTPTASGTTSFFVQIADRSGNSTTKAFQLQILAAPSIATPSPLPGGTVNTPYSPLTLTGSGGTAPLQWSSGQLPAGLILSSGGVLSGTPTSAGTSSFSVTLTDAVGATASASFSLTVSSQLTIISSSPLPRGAVGSLYSFTFQASGGSGSYTWSVASGSLPPGLSLNNSSGALSGKPLGTGNFAFVIQVTDIERENQASKTFTMVIATAVPPLRITSPAALTGELGTNYSFAFSATGGTPPYTWSIVNGALPAGLTLSASGVVSGKASGVGPFSFTIQVMDTAENSAVQSIQLQFTLPPAPPLQITGIPTNPPANTQPSFQITIPNAFSFDIQGVLTLTFHSPSGVDDPAIQFTNGTRILGFTIPAGSTIANYASGESPVFLTGTIAGTITLTTTQYQAFGLSLTPAPAPFQVVIPATAPVITSVTATHGSGGFTVTVVGYSPTRDVTGGTFSFLGSNLNTPQLSLDLSTLFQGWFSNTTSDQFGSQFKLTQPFNLNGGSGNVKSVSVTLTNSIGTSQLATVPVE